MLSQPLEHFPPHPAPGSVSTHPLRDRCSSVSWGLLSHSSPHGNPPQKQGALQPSHCQPPTQQEFKAGARAYVPQFPQQLSPQSGRSQVQVLPTLLDFSRCFVLFFNSPMQFHPDSYLLHVHLGRCPDLGQKHLGPWAHTCHTL